MTTQTPNAPALPVVERQAVPSTNSDPRPVYEMRPLPQHTGATVLRYADGSWIPDDGEWDVAFVSYGMGPPYGLGVRLPHQRNIAWSGLTTSWMDTVAEHPRGNPWHYMLAEGESEWGGPYEPGPMHLNARAMDAAMNKCAAINRCANGRGPEFKIGDPYIRAGLLRERETGRVVVEPNHLYCMYCGEKWQRSEAARAALARTGEAK